MLALLKTSIIAHITVLTIHVWCHGMQVFVIFLYMGLYRKGGGGQ